MKDAKGHGSNGRGGGLNPTEQRMAAHGQRVLDVVRGMSLPAPNTGKEAAETLRSRYGYTNVELAQIRGRL